MNKEKGFTLIELMIVVAIVAILASFAYPSYTQHTIRAKRADGHGFLLDVASRQERFYTQNVTYTGTMLGGAGLNYTTATSPEGHYTVAITCSPSNANCASFTATATPVSADSECTTLTYNSLGVKGSSGTGSVDDCWR